MFWLLLIESAATVGATVSAGGAVLFIEIVVKVSALP